MRLPAHFYALLATLVVAASSPGAPRDEEVGNVEFRGVWVASVANIDWPSRAGLPAEEQQSELLALFDRAAELKLNAIIFQIRPASDALYKSTLEPWSYYLTGAMGEPPQSEYDPLKFAVAAAHARGMQLHAWFNPYRVLHPTNKGEVAESHISRTRPDLVRRYGKYLWLDPGEPDAADHSLAVIADVVQRYDVDGVHIDDYFYPYPVRNDAGKITPFPDDASFRKAQTNLPRDDWRRQNVDQFVERMYERVKSLKPRVLVGISPFGIWRPGHPPGIDGLDQYATLYADARKWLRNGWVDYFSPQLYWKIDSHGQSYPKLLAWWVDQNRHGRHIWPGLYTSRVANQGLGNWSAEEIVNQITVTRGQAGAQGHVHFSMKALLENRDGLADRLQQETYAERASVPESPWLE